MYVSKAPLRVSLFGGGTDYVSYYRENDAGVIGGTIDKYVYTFVSDLPLQAPQKYRINYRVTENVDSVSEISHPVIREALRLYYPNTSLNISTMSDVLGGSGLGSSSAFTVSLLQSLSSITNHNILPSELWRRAVYIEREVLNEVGGVQDQLHASYGGFKYYKLSSEGISCEDMFHEVSGLDYFSSCCVLIKIGGLRKSFEIAANQNTRTINKDNNSYLTDMMAILREARSIMIRPEVNENSIDEIGRLLDETWELKKNLGSSVSNFEIDEFVNYLKSLGALGCKLLGAGGAGYLLVLARKDTIDLIREKLGHKNQGVNTCGNRLFRGILDQRFINNWQQLHLHSLGRWKEARAKTSDRKDSFLYLLHGFTPYTLKPLTPVCVKENSNIFL